MPPKMQMVLVDLDGTLLNNEKQIGRNDFRALQILGEKEIIRVFATGRTLFSSLKVLHNNTPFDYLVFSSGSGIMDWHTKEIIFKSSLNQAQITEIETKLRRLDVNFTIQLPIPENHHYYYYSGSNYSADFENRNKIYAEYSKALNGGYHLDEACQFLVILNDETRFESLKANFSGYKVIRATSPIDNRSVWLEIFNSGVSKAMGGQFICKLSGIKQKCTIGIGNDYNDLDLLNWVAFPFIVSNAPELLKTKYQPCVDNLNNPLTDVLKKTMPGLLTEY